MTTDNDIVPAKGWLWFLGGSLLLSLVATLFPILIILGLILFIFPGVILMFAPAAFLWSIFGTIIWIALAPFSAGIRISGALAFTALFFWFIPLAINADVIEDANAFTETDISPSAPILLSGSVELIGPNFGRDGSIENTSIPKCDELCMALLMQPGVSDVIVTRQSSERERQLRGRFWFERASGQCLNNEAIIFSSAWKTDDDNFDEYRNFRNKIKSKLAGGACIAFEAAGSATAPTVIRFDRKDLRTPVDYGRKEGAFSTDHVRMSSNGIPWFFVYSIEILKRGEAEWKRLAAQTYVRHSIVARPFHFGFEGSGTHGMEMKLGIARSIREAGKFKIVNWLEKHSDFSVETDARIDLASAVDTILSNSNLKKDAPSLSLVNDYVASLSEVETLTPSDRRRLRAIVLDHRIEDVFSLDRILRKHDEAAGGLRDAIATRIMAAGEPAIPEIEEMRGARRYGFLFKDFPAESFAMMTDQERYILSQPTLRVMAPGLIERMADAGQSAVPELLTIVEETGRAANLIVIDDGMIESEAESALRALAVLDYPVETLAKPLFYPGSASGWREVRDDVKSDILRKKKITAEIAERRR